MRPGSRRASLGRGLRAQDHGVLDAPGELLSDEAGGSRDQRFHAIIHRTSPPDAGGFRFSTLMFFICLPELHWGPTQVAGSSRGEDRPGVQRFHIRPYPRVSVRPRIRVAAISMQRRQFLEVRTRQR